MKIVCLERQYKNACLNYHKALKAHEQVQMQYIKSQRHLEEANRHKRAVLSQLAGKKVEPTNLPASRAATRSPTSGSGQRLGGNGSNKSSSRLLDKTPARKYKIGERLRKKFNGQFYEGTITALPKPQRFYYHVAYDDGDEEDISVAKMKDYIIEHVIEEESANPNHVANSKRPVDSIDIEPSRSSDDDSTLSGLVDSNDSSMERQVAALPRRKKPKVLVSATDQNDGKQTTSPDQQTTSGAPTQEETMKAKVSSSASDGTAIESPPGITRRTANEPNSATAPFEEQE